MTRISSADWILAVPSPWGEFLAGYSRAGLRALFFPGRAPNVFALKAPTPPKEVAGWHQLTCQSVGEVLQGVSVTQLPPFDWSGATEFQRAVWEALLTIPRGQLRTYACVAHQVGRPRAARAVGAACGANPIPLLAPCHRVIASNLRLGGFSAGLEWKEKLLRLEGHKIFRSRQVW